MKYLIIDNNVIELTRFYKNLHILYIEIDKNGSVLREIGLNNIGEIVHAYPSDKYKYGKYGIFDLNSFDINNLKNEIDLDYFECKWNSK